jgi:hypothetical protein
MRIYYWPKTYKKFPSVIREMKTKKPKITKNSDHTELKKLIVSSSDQFVVKGASIYIADKNINCSIVMWSVLFYMCVRFDQ